MGILRNVCIGASFKVKDGETCHLMRCAILKLWILCFGSFVYLYSTVVTVKPVLRNAVQCTVGVMFLLSDHIVCCLSGINDHVS